MCQELEVRHIDFFPLHLTSRKFVLLLNLVTNSAHLFSRMLTRSWRRVPFLFWHCNTNISVLGLLQMIAKNTDKMVFTSAMYEPEDCHCVICLGDYEENEELRKLPCKRTWP